MKIVREYINEKFTEVSDPIHDLGIGGIDINDEWEDINNAYTKGNAIDIYIPWKARLEELFLGRKVTGNFSEGNSSSYGGVQRGITTKTPVIRIELEDDRNFSLVCIKKGSWENHPEDEGGWVDPDEIWYVVDLKNNLGRKIFIK